MRQSLATGFRLPGGRGMLVMVGFLAYGGLGMLLGAVLSFEASRSQQRSYRPESVGVRGRTYHRGQPGYEHALDTRRHDLEERGRIGVQVFGSALLLVMCAIGAILVICYRRGRARLLRAPGRGPGALASGCG